MNCPACEKPINDGEPIIAFSATHSHPSHPGSLTLINQGIHVTCFLAMMGQGYDGVYEMRERVYQFLDKEAS